jgi:two-component system, chemotaxis family, CheB/CheR fusion protein
VAGLPAATDRAAGRVYDSFVKVGRASQAAAARMAFGLGDMAMAAPRTQRPDGSDAAPVHDAPRVPTDESPRFPVVGVGASAGGLEAVSQLLELIPADTGMALCVVQHLAPNHESLLAELLSRKSHLPVSEVTDGVPVERDHAYVIPPDTDLRLDGGRLRLTARDHTQRPPLPIDAFFRSLASTLGRRAIGVVLSGAASDGTLGLAAIKAEGGITFAQDPATAKYDGMPRAAIAAGAVDFVLTPRKIAAELKRLARHPYVAPGTPEGVPGRPAHKDSYAEIFRLLRQARGVDFGQYKFSTIGRRVTRRLALRRLESVDEYVALLRDDPAELEALFQDILIMVTEFFREPATYEALRTEVFPRLLEGRAPDKELRVWVPGCASGEEVYSLAIALREFLKGEPVRPAVKIFATDVNPRAIERARSGLYGESIAGSMPAELLSRYFTKVDDGYQVRKTIRELCVFAVHDVTRDPPFSRLDLVSCRNLLIYLGPLLQKRVIPTLHYALTPGGYLVLGTAEAVGGNGDRLFETVDKKQRIYRARGQRPALPGDVWPPPSEPTAGIATRATRAAARARRGAPFDLDRAADEAVLTLYASPAVIVDDALQIVRFRGETEPYLRHTSGVASFDLLAMAGQALGVHLGAAVGEVRRAGAPVTLRDLPWRHDERRERLDVHVAPLAVPDGERYYVVVFEPVAASAAAPAAGGATSAEAETIARELAATRDYLQTVIEDQEVGNEELRAANEEVQSSNEELQSINEELETAKEELQSTNEELATVNDELSGRNAELSALTDDLSNLFASVDIPLIMVGRDLHIRHLTPATHEALGIALDVLGTPLADVDLHVGVADLAQRVRGVIETLVPLATETQNDEGRWYSLRVQPYRTAGSVVEGAVIALVDIDAVKRSADQIRDTALLNAALAGIHLAISSTLEPGEILSRAVVESARALQAETASIAVREGGDWVTRYAFGYDDDVLGSRFTDLDLPHVALAAGTRSPVAINHAGRDDRTSLAAVNLLRLRSVLAVPLVSKDEVSGVLLFNWHDHRVSLSSAQVDFAAKLATAVSLSLDNARLYAERNESVRLAEALNDIGVAVSSAHGTRTIAQIVAGEGMRVLGCEGAVAALVEGEEYVTHVALGAGKRLLGERFHRDDNPIIGALELTREPFVASDARHDQRLAPGFAERFGLQSLLFVPFVVHDQVTGVLAFANLDSPTTFTDDQARFAAALATAGALAIENERVYEVEHRTAESLRKLLARPLPVLPGLLIGAAYRAAAAAERVGGDFFDVFALDERTVALLIADVSGKGVPAAGFTETIRSAVRAVAYLDRSPAFVLDHVNQSLMRQATGGPTETLFATAALHIIDLVTGDVRYASAGHPPAVVCGKRCEALPIVPGVPLGTFAKPHTEQTAHLARGEVLVAFTDGITEARRGKALFGDRRLMASLSGGGRDPQELVDHVLAAAMKYAGGDLTDDAAVIAVALVDEPETPRG